MRNTLVVLIILLSIFLATGCADNTYNRTHEPGVPPQEPSVPIENSAVSQVSDTKVATFVVVTPLGFNSVSI